MGTYNLPPEEVPSPSSVPPSETSSAPPAEQASHMGPPKSPAFTISIPSVVLLPGVLLVVLFVGTLIELSLAGWAANTIIDGTYIGNVATVPFLIAALLSGMVGAAAIPIGFQYLFIRTPSTLAADHVITVLDLSLSLLAFGFACKEIDADINPGGVVGRYFGFEPRVSRLQALEAFVIILFLLKLFRVVGCTVNLFKWRSRDHTLFGQP